MALVQRACKWAGKAPPKRGTGSGIYLERRSIPTLETTRIGLTRGCSWRRSKPCIGQKLKALASIHAALWRDYFSRQGEPVYRLFRPAESFLRKLGHRSTSSTRSVTAAMERYFMGCGWSSALPESPNCGSIGSNCQRGRNTRGEG
jgi:hypothetical protein